MKITIVQGAFLPIPPKLGGAVEKMWYGLAKEFVNQGHQVEYISKSYKGYLNKEQEGGINHLRVSGYTTPSYGILLKFLDLLYTLRAIKKIATDTDIIISNTFWLPLILSSYQKKSVSLMLRECQKGKCDFILIVLV
jgi:hypothetical protein